MAFEAQNQIRRLKWIFGTTYAVQGSSDLSDIPTLYFIKFVLQMGDGVPDKRTLILQLFVYISLFFTLLAAPVVLVLKHALNRYGIQISDIEPTPE